MAGKMFAAQAKALAEAAGEAKNMKEQITGTNIAEEQAKTNTDNLDGALKGLSSAWEGLNLHINSSNGVLNVHRLVRFDHPFTRLATAAGGQSGHCWP